MARCLLCFLESNTLPFLYIDLKKKIPSANSEWGMEVDYYSKDRFPKKPVNSIGDTDTSWVVPKGQGVQTQKAPDLNKFPSASKVLEEEGIDKPQLLLDPKKAKKPRAPRTKKEKVIPLKEVFKDEEVPEDGLKITDSKRQVSVSAARQAAREMMAGKKLSLGKKGPPDGDGLLLPAKPQIVDQIMKEAGLEKAHRAWLGIDSKPGDEQHGWYIDADDSIGVVGKWLVRDPDPEEVEELARSTGYVGDPDHLAQVANAQYAVTQEALRKRIQEGKLPQVDKDGYITLYRGISSRQSIGLGEELKKKGKSDLKVRSISSWTSNPDVAKDFGNMTIKQRVHISRVFAQWEQSDFSSRVYGGEEEWVLAYPEESISITEENIHKD